LRRENGGTVSGILGTKHGNKGENSQRLKKKRKGESPTRIWENASFKPTMKDMVELKKRVTGGGRGTWKGPMGVEKARAAGKGVGLKSL